MAAPISTKKRPVIKRHLLLNLDVKCEWKGCGNASLSKLIFYKHISEHVKEVEISLDESEEEHYICLWSNCIYTSKDAKEITRHVKYHAYISGLKALGSHYSETLALPPCLITPEYHVTNNVGEIPYICYWNECGASCPGIQEFIDHVHHHVKSIDSNEEVKCLWAGLHKEVKDDKLAPIRDIVDLFSTNCQIHYKPGPHLTIDERPLLFRGYAPGRVNMKSKPAKNLLVYLGKTAYRPEKQQGKRVVLDSVSALGSDCSSKFRYKCNLCDHVKVHTKGHFVACPNCENTFANKTKFADHCFTQKPLEEHTFQCDYCLSFHPTERILRKHMAQHINHYSCPFCNMTCNKPSLLVRHIRNRHLDYKYFKCSSCSYQCKSHYDLKCHLMSHVRGSLPCLETGCSYIGKSQLGLKHHYEYSHGPGSELGPFVCHVCDKKFIRGTTLTKHLLSKHNIKKPPGYSRFLYKVDADGCRRLQTIRLESVDPNELSDYEEVPNVNLINGKHTVATSMQEITVDLLGEKGQVLSSCIVTPDVSLPPPEAQILAIGS